MTVIVSVAQSMVRHTNAFCIHAFCFQRGLAGYVCTVQLRRMDFRSVTPKRNKGGIIETDRFKKINDCCSDCSNNLYSYSTTPGRG